MKFSRTVLASDFLPTSRSEKLVDLKMSGSKLRLPLLLRRVGDALLWEDFGFGDSAEPRCKSYFLINTINFT